MVYKDKNALFHHLDILKHINLGNSKAEENLGNEIVQYIIYEQINVIF